MEILSRRTKNNPCLVGEPGVGKTAVVEGLAQDIAAGNIPEVIQNKRVLTLDLSGMVAGSKYRGEFEERIKRAIKEVMQAGNVLLFIDEIHTIIGAGGLYGRSINASAAFAVCVRHRCGARPFIYFDNIEAAAVRFDRYL